MIFIKMEQLIDSWTRILRFEDVVLYDDEHHVVQTNGLDIQRLCWHCCHPWQGEALQYPFAYDDRTRKFKVGGQFCSFSCIKGYARDTMSVAVSGVHMMNIRHYKKVITGKADMIVPAPPRITLKVFGGDLSIEEFRQETPNVEYVLNHGHLIKIIPYERHEYKSNERNVTMIETDTAVNIMPSTVKNEHLKLRRTKPLSQGRTNIERTLGLNSFANLIKTTT